jgi:hypothetical protein
MESQTTEQTPRKKNVYKKERYEQKKEEILKDRREGYRTIHKKDLNMKESTGTFTISIELFLYYLIVKMDENERKDLHLRILKNDIKLNCYKINL